MIGTIVKGDMLSNLRNPLTKSLWRAVSAREPQATKRGLHNISKDSVDSQHEEKGKMRGWQIHEYGNVDVLKYTHNINVPDVRSRNDVVVQVHAASVNPIDVAMMSK